MSNGQAVVEFDGLVLAHNERTVAEITHVAIGGRGTGTRSRRTRFQVGRVTDSDHQAEQTRRDFGPLSCTSDDAGAQKGH